MISKRLIGYWKLWMTSFSRLASVSSSTEWLNGTTRLPRGVRVTRTWTSWLPHERTASNKVASNESLKLSPIDNVLWYSSQSIKGLTGHLYCTIELGHFCIRCKTSECFPDHELRRRFRSVDEVCTPADFSILSLRVDVMSMEYLCRSTYTVCLWISFQNRSISQTQYSSSRFRVTMSYFLNGELWHGCQWLILTVMSQKCWH